MNKQMKMIRDENILLNKEMKKMQDIHREMIKDHMAIKDDRDLLDIKSEILKEIDQKI